MSRLLSLFPFLFLFSLFSFFSLLCNPSGSILPQILSYYASDSCRPSNGSRSENPFSFDGAAPATGLIDPQQRDSHNTVQTGLHFQGVNNTVFEGRRRPNTHTLAFISD